MPEEESFGHKGPPSLVSYTLSYRMEEWIREARLEYKEKLGQRVSTITGQNKLLHFVVFVVIQSVLFFCYIMYKSQQEAAAKKFF